MLLRLANLGYQNHSMTCDDIDLQVVAKDASLLQGTGRYRELPDDQHGGHRPGREPGRDLHRAGGPGEYLLYDRRYSLSSNNGGGPGYGGMMTEISVKAPGTLPAQTQPNT